MLYLNTKCTGAVVAQQPFGGTMAHLQRFVGTWMTKEEYVPLERVIYLCFE